MWLNIHVKETSEERNPGSAVQNVSRTSVESPAVFCRRPSAARFCD